MSKPTIWAIGGKFPYVHRLKHMEKDLAPVSGKDWVILPDGRVGVIDHIKNNGLLGVRPINPTTGAFYPNPAMHWSEEQRRAVPEEIALAAHEIKYAVNGQVPTIFRVH